MENRTAGGGGPPRLGCFRVAYRTCNAMFYLGPRIASLAALEMLNRTFLLLGLIFSLPASGPNSMVIVLAGLSTSFSLPMPGRVNTFLAFAWASSACAWRNWTACFLLMPTFSASCVAISDLVIDFLPPTFAIRIELLSMGLGMSPWRGVPSPDSLVSSPHRRAPYSGGRLSFGRGG